MLLKSKEQIRWEEVKMMKRWKTTEEKEEDEEMK